MSQTIEQLREFAVDKVNFQSLEQYFSFGEKMVDFLSDDANTQARIVAKNLPKYQFFQHGEKAGYQISRPVNTEIWSSAETYRTHIDKIREVTEKLRGGETDTSPEARAAFISGIYTTQQAIGVCLDSLPAGQSNQARKLNGDLFEDFINYLVNDCGAKSASGVLKVPIKDDNGEEQFKMSYQHDMMLLDGAGDLAAIGSVKTSSKDRMAKVFIDKFLYSRLTETELPHFAIFLNDVQRAGKEPNYGISKTFLRGHFKGYTMKLNALDGVYFADILPDMQTDPLLKEHIDTIDKFFIDDLHKFMRGPKDDDAIIIPQA